jgi:hypothetical protein
MGTTCACSARVAVADSWPPQFEQVRVSGDAHSSQNFAPERFSCWHRGHFIEPLSSQDGGGRDGGTNLAPGQYGVNNGFNQRGHKFFASSRPGQLDGYFRAIARDGSFVLTCAEEQGACSLSARRESTTVYESIAPRER